MNMQNSEMTTTGSFLEKVINTMPGGVFVYRANEKQEILYMNREILHLWDCQDKDQFMEFCGGSFRGMIHPDDRDLVEQEIISQLRLGNRDFDHVRYRMINREGKLHTVENFGKYVDDPDLGGLFFVFFCKPLPSEEALEVCKKKNIRGETKDDQEFYQNISAQKYLDSGQIKSLSAPEMLENEQTSVFINADQAVKQIMQRYICECEYEQYLEFMDLNTLANRLEHADGGVLNTVFSVKTKTREKVFNMHRILQVQGTERKVYLYLIYGVNLSSAKEGAILIENSDAKDVREEQTNAHEQGCTQQIRD